MKTGNETAVKIPVKPHENTMQLALRYAVSESSGATGGIVAMREFVTITSQGGQ